jgi:type II secretory pathway component PulK
VTGGVRATKEMDGTMSGSAVSERTAAEWRRGGFILIAALWLLVALGAVGLDAALRSRSRRLAAANLLDETRARAAATAGVEYARSRLTAAMLDRADELRAEAVEAARSSRQRSQAQRRSVTSLFRRSDPFEDPWRAPEELIQQEMAFGDARYSLRVRDTGAALNLNEMDEEVLRQFFSQGMGIDYAYADRLAQAIMDWRDADELPRLGGAERDQYLDAEAPMLPPNRDFAELDELRYVMGMTPELFEASKPYLTLIGSGDVNVNAAPEAVLLALPDMTPSAVTELMRLREIGAVPRSGDQLRALIPMLDGSSRSRERLFDRITTFTTNEVEILAEGRVEGSPIRVQARVVVARSNTGAVVVWRRFD